MQNLLGHYNCDNGLVVINVSDPANPVLMSETDTAGIAQDLALKDNHILVADGAAGIQVSTSTIPPMCLPWVLPVP